MKKGQRTDNRICFYAYTADRKAEKPQNKQANTARKNVPKSQNRKQVDPHSMIVIEIWQS